MSRESEWHVHWKATLQHRLGAELEVHMGAHRADAVLGELVIELQAGYLTVDQIRHRETFYGDHMVWLYDGALFARRIHWGQRGFWIKNGPACLTAHRRPLFVASPSSRRILRVTSLSVLGNADGPSRVLGRGHAYSRAEFLDLLRQMASR